MESKVIACIMYRILPCICKVLHFKTFKGIDFYQGNIRKNHISLTFSAYQLDIFLFKIAKKVINYNNNKILGLRRFIIGFVYSSRYKTLANLLTVHVGVPYATSLSIYT